MVGLYNQVVIDMMKGPVLIKKRFSYIVKGI